MFCHQCGKELHENARFCFNCGTPVREVSEQTGTILQTESTITGAGNPDLQTENPDSGRKPSALQTENLQTRDASTNTEEPGSRTQDSSTDTEEPGSRTQDSSTGTATPEQQEVLPPPAAADAGAPADLILKKGKVIVTGRELHLNRKHYIRKSGRRKFKKEKKASVIPLGTILGTSMEHHKYGGRIFLSLLLLVCFAAGALFSSRYGYETYNELNTPYREKELAEQESILAIIDNDGAGQLLQYQDRQAENRADTETLSARLAELKTRQTQEILAAIYTSNRFDLDDFFNRDLFSRAYQEYLQELLDIFKADEALNSWLYSYYETTKEYGGNYFLDTDMWIYNGDGENRFSSGLDSAASLMSDQYDLDLYEHILFTGRIYITGADFMQKILSLPRYTVDGAVFTKAYGGVPDPAEMSVPGWSRSHYEEFWLYGVDYYNVDTPMWLDYGLSAVDFELDWNSLVDETAYYTAYRNFVDKIDPNLPCYDVAVYHADDTAYGGMGFSLKGEEASFSDIIASYAENHPEFIDELMKSGSYGNTSVDEEIAGTETRLEELESELLDLQDQEKELAQILADADMHRNSHALLLADLEQHTRELTRRLLFLGGATLLCVLASLICLCRFFGFLKRPRHLFIISGQDMQYAFNARHYSREQIVTLQNRLPRQDADRT